MATNPVRDLPAGLEIRGAMQSGYETILTPAALEFVVDLTRRFGDRVASLLAVRAVRQTEIDAGRGRQNLSGAIRVYILEKARAGELSRKTA